jgi:hypothetical protein
MEALSSTNGIPPTPGVPLFGIGYDARTECLPASNRRQPKTLPRSQRKAECHLWHGGVNLLGLLARAWGVVWFPGLWSRLTNGLGVRMRVPVGSCVREGSILSVWETGSRGSICLCLRGIRGWMVYICRAWVPRLRSFWGFVWFRELGISISLFTPHCWR